MLRRLFDPVTLGQEFLAQGGVELVKSFFGGIGTKAGEGIGKQIPQTVENYMTIKFGLKTEDERLYNLAVSKMKLPDRVRLGKKLVTLRSDNPALSAEANRQLSDERFNYFRICLPLNDMEKTLEILTGYAKLDSDFIAWNRECEIMGFRFESDGITLTKVGDAIVVKYQRMNATFTAHPVRNQMKSYRDRARDRANRQSW